MATRDKSSSTNNPGRPGESSSESSARSTVSGPARADMDVSAAPDAHAAKSVATQSLAAAMPYNANKEGEHGDLAPIRPPESR